MGKTLRQVTYEEVYCSQAKLLIETHFLMEEKVFFI